VKERERESSRERKGSFATKGMHSNAREGMQIKEQCSTLKRLYNMKFCEVVQQFVCTEFEEAVQHDFWGRLAHISRLLYNNIDTKVDTTTWHGFLRKNLYSSYN
jgi:hypothetical protein